MVNERRADPHLPGIPVCPAPFLSFTPEEWQEKGHEYGEIRDNAPGRDVTDYGHGDYNALDLALITLRNGNVRNPSCTKVYAEKIMMVREGQISPNHFHWHKMEDIYAGAAGTWCSGFGTPRRTRAWQTPRCRCAKTGASTMFSPAVR